MLINFLVYNHNNSDITSKKLCCKEKTKIETNQPSITLPHNTIEMTLHTHPTLPFLIVPTIVSSISLLTIHCAAIVIIVLQFVADCAVHMWSILKFSVLITNVVTANAALKSNLQPSNSRCYV